jgi:hypothetical protein
MTSELFWAGGALAFASTGAIYMAWYWWVFLRAHRHFVERLKTNHELRARLQRVVTGPVCDYSDIARWENAAVLMEREARVLRPAERRRMLEFLRQPPYESRLYVVRSLLRRAELPAS